jgi:dynein intermediate chain 1
MTGNNPQVPSNVVSYNFVEKEFKGVPGAADEHITVHLHIAGGVLHQDSEEGAEQRAWERNYRALVEERRREKMRVAQEEGKELSELDLEDDLQRNQFNYTERAAQTYNPVSRTRVVCTEPPETSEASGSMSQWQIYDAYVAEQERLTAAANAEKAGAGNKGSSAPTPVTNESLSRAVANAMASFATVPHGKPSLEDPMHSPQMNHALQIMERLVNQNGEDEVYSDFKFWEDASDAFRDNLGTCLPLWRFEDARTRKKQVTAIAWNTGHHDLFAVGYGSYDMLRQGSG